MVAWGNAGLTYAVNFDAGVRKTIEEEANGDTGGITGGSGDVNVGASTSSRIVKPNDVKAIPKTGDESSEDEIEVLYDTNPRNK